MGKLSLGILFEEKEYEKRLCALLMNYYRAKVDLYIYSDETEICAKQLSAILCDDAARANALARTCEIKVIAFVDNVPKQRENEKVIYMEKYMDVSRVIAEIVQQIGSEISEIMESGDIHPHTKMIGVYGLCETAYQLPLAMTLGSIFAEKERVILLDLQENSGLTRKKKPEEALNLEDLLLGIRNDNCTKEKLEQAILKEEYFDCFYPISNTEIYGEIDKSSIRKLIDLIRTELDYSIILVNFGSRFRGFFELLNLCAQVYMLQTKSGLGQWREYEFVEEICKRGYERMIDRLVKVELPIVTQSVSSFEELVDKWCWDEFGEQLRKLSMQGAAVG